MFWTLEENVAIVRREIREKHYYTSSYLKTKGVFSMAATKTKKKKTDNKKMMQALQFIMPLLLIGLGVLLIRRRDALNQVFMAIGIVIALIGLIYTVVYYATKQYEKKPPYLASGIGLLVIGGIIIIIPFLADTFIPFCIALFILNSAISG